MPVDQWCFVEVQGVVALGRVCVVLVDAVVDGGQGVSTHGCFEQQGADEEVGEHFVGVHGGGRPNVESGRRHLPRSGARRESQSPRWQWTRLGSGGA